MPRHPSIDALAAAAGCLLLSAMVVGQQARPSEGVRPPLCFREQWKQPPYAGSLDDEKRRVTQAALSNPALEVTLYGPAAHQIGVYSHEGRLDLWSGLAPSPTAVTLKDTQHYLDLTGLARLRWIVRTQALHVVYPVVKLPDGALLAGSHGVATDGDFIQTEIAFGGTVRWFSLDPERVVTTGLAATPDLSRVDEIGWVDLAPGGGKGNAGWYNISTIEVYGRLVPRSGASPQ